MCRLFGMSGGDRRVRATFWLLEAPDSLAEQSRHNADGYGLATFEVDGEPRVLVEKRPVAAYEDELFAREANERRSPQFLAHVRYASTGPTSMENTHPFEQEERVFAHNGHIEGLDALDERERRIVELRFFDEMTQSQIAAEVGISQMHVSRLLRRALTIMRGRIEEVAPRDE